MQIDPGRLAGRLHGLHDGQCDITEQLVIEVTPPSLYKKSQILISQGSELGATVF